MNDMNNLIISTTNKDNLVKTALFLYSLGYMFPSNQIPNEEYILYLYDSVFKLCTADAIMCIGLEGKFMTINTKEHYYSDRKIKTQIQSPIK